MIQVYTGNGKGKTTAALGLCVRARGAGIRVYFGQFLKKGSYSEIRALKSLGCVTVEQFGTGEFLRTDPGKKELAAAARGLSRARRALACGKYGMVILDEFNVALKLGLFGRDEALTLLASVPEGVELVLTGRDADRAVVACADLVSEVQEVKHYYSKGTKGRKGIEF